VPAALSSRKIAISISTGLYSRAGAHDYPGGRSLNDDIVDKFFTPMGGGVDGSRSGNGVDKATQPATHSCPHLASPNPGPAPLTPAF
jgi:hypothetical protein